MSDKETPVGTPFHLVDHVPYALGSVVSKTLVKKDTGTVTLFSFAEGQGLSEHTAPFDALVYVYDGEAEVTIDGKKLRRTYSICSPAGTWPLEIGVRIQPGGAFGEFAARELEAQGAEPPSREAGPCPTPLRLQGRGASARRRSRLWS